MRLKTFLNFFVLLTSFQLAFANIKASDFKGSYHLKWSDFEEQMKTFKSNPSSLDNPRGLISFLVYFSFINFGKTNEYQYGTDKNFMLEKMKELGISSKKLENNDDMSQYIYDSGQWSLQDKKIIFQSSPNQKSPYKIPSLHIIKRDGLNYIVEISQGNSKTTARLEKITIKPSSNREPRKILFNAAQKGDIAEVKRALSLGVDVNTKNNFKWTALHIATTHKKVKIVELLLEQPGIDVNAVDDRNFSPLVYAGEVGSRVITEMLIAHGADIKRFGSKAIEKASSHNHVEVITVLRKKLNGPYLDKSLALHKASGRNGSLESVKTLVELGADVNYRDPEYKFPRTALTLALYNKNEEIASYLILEAKAKIDSPDYFNSAIRKCSLEILELLLNHGSNVNDMSEELGWRPIHRAYFRNNPKVLEFLVERGADVNGKCRRGETALHLAAGYGSLEMVKTLVALGSDITLLDSEGKTALERAKYSGKKEVINYLESL